MLKSAASRSAFWLTETSSQSRQPFCGRTQLFRALAGAPFNVWFTNAEVFDTTKSAPTAREHTVPHSRGVKTPELCQQLPSRIEGAGNAGRSMHPQPRMQNKKAYEHSHHGHTGFTRHSPRNGFNGFLRALPGDRAFLSPSSAETSSANLTPASRRQDHTTSPSALAPFVSAAFASTASRPAFVTIASRPSVGRDGAVVKVIWVNREQIYFCEKGWTGEQPICPSGKERTGAIFAKPPVMTTCAGREASGHQHSCSEG